MAPSIKDQWFLELNGKKLGPYTYAQIVSRLKDKQLLPESKITAAHLGGKWITVREMVGQSPALPASAPAPAPTPAPEHHTIPPRPNEKTLHAIAIAPKEPIPARAQKLDPIFDLLRIVQTAKEKKTVKKSALLDMPAPSTGASQGPWAFIAVLGVGGAAVWGIIAVLSSYTIKVEDHPEPSAHTIAASKPVEPASVTQAPVQPPVVVARPAARPVAMPALRPVVRPAPNPVVADKDRDRDRDRERDERDRERERDEKERDRELAQQQDDNSGERVPAGVQENTQNANQANLSNSGAAPNPDGAPGVAPQQPDINALGYPVDSNGNVLPPPSETEGRQ